MDELTVSTSWIVIMKAVALLSGGVDSATLLYKLRSEGCEVHALTLLYGQRHSREIEAARAICSAAKVEHRIIDISSVKWLLRSALTDSAIEIPEVPETAEHYDTLKITIVPNRNAILLSIATAYAMSIGADLVAYAAHFSDRGVYPDCRKEFVEAFEKAMRLANEAPELRVEAPFVDMNKRDIVKLGSALRVPYELTWSCYKGGEKHCGACSSCRERKRAFSEAGVRDPTQYEE